MTRTYRQPQWEERVTLAALRQQGRGLRDIGRVLGRSPGAPSRELTRNHDAHMATPRAWPSSAARPGASRVDVPPFLKPLLVE